MGENKKVTIMVLVLKVDLQCEKCYRKVKKVLCKFPQIRDQNYDEKNNQVIIKVVYCNPEKIRDKLCCKGGCVIKRIDIKPEPETVTVKPKPLKPPVTPSPPETPQVTCTCPRPTCTCPRPTCTCPRPTCTCPRPTCTCPRSTCTCPRPTCSCPRPTCTCPRPTPPVPCPRPTTPVPCPRPPVNTCCTECSEGRPGGPCEIGYCGRPVYDSYDGWRSHNTSSYCVTRPDCFSEENPQACAIM